MTPQPFDQTIREARDIIDREARKALALHVDVDDARRWLSDEVERNPELKESLITFACMDVIDHVADDQGLPGPRLTDKYAVRM